MGITWCRCFTGIDTAASDRSHALRGNTSLDALRPLLGRGASRAALPRRAWERSVIISVSAPRAPESPGLPTDAPPVRRLGASHP
ncbi:hypothetical protein C7A12_14865 [Pseudomonas fluorescens]|nr:hypothetical protein C7A12_14865 [Pseudomonas fluorescens]PRW77833.1 hypothetical protein C7A13_14475 [Pseudomonas fluorescens]